MPSLDLVKRIAASDKRTSFVGSDFLYEDVSGRGLDQDIHELAETTDAFYVIKNTPKKPETRRVQLLQRLDRPKNFVPMKMEFYDKAAASSTARSSRRRSRRSRAFRR